VLSLQSSISVSAGTARAMSKVEKSLHYDRPELSHRKHLAKRDDKSELLN
jgi:hypothetical protein